MRERAKFRERERDGQKSETLEKTETEDRDREYRHDALSGGSCCLYPGITWPDALFVGNSSDEYLRFLVGTMG